MAKQKTDRLLRIAICALTVALIFAIYSGIHQRVVIAGESAPDFSLTTDNGRTVSLTGRVAEVGWVWSGIIGAGKLK